MKKNLKQFIIDTILNLKEVMFLQEWDIEIELKEMEDYTTAEISINDRYLDATIMFNEKRIKKWYESGKKNKLVDVIIHELSHIITEPFYVIAIDAVSNQTKETLEDVREKQTQRIANIIHNLLNN